MSERLVVCAALLVPISLGGCSFVFSTIRDAVESSGPGGARGALLAESEHARGATGGGRTHRALSCGNAAGSPQRSYSFVAPRSTTYTFDSTTSDYDGVIAVWDPSGDRELACNDDHTGTRASQVTLALAEGQTVEIVQGGYSGASGHYELWVTGGPAIATAAAGAPPQPLAVGATVSGDTRFRAPIAGISCPPSSPMEEWVFTPAADGSFLFQVQSDYDAYLGIVQQSDGASIACNDDTGDTRHTQAAVDLVQGATYRVVVGGYSGQSGTYTLTATALTSGGALTLGQPVFFASGTTNTHPDVCGAPAGSLDRTFTFRPPTDAFYVIHTDAPGWLVVDDGHRTLACVALGGEHRAGIALKPAHRYDIVLEMGSGGAGAHYLSIERTAPDGPEWRGESPPPASVDLL